MSSAKTSISTLDDIIELINWIPEEVDSICIMVSNFDESEGAGNVAIRQIEALQDAGYQCSVATFETNASIQPDNEIILSSDTSQSITSQNIDRLLYAFSPAHILKASLELRQYDLLVVHQPVLCPIALATKQFHNSETVYYNHHITWPSEKSGTIGKIFGYTGYLPLLYASSRLDHVVSVSSHSMGDYEKLFSKTGPVIYNSIDEGVYNTDVDGSEIRRKYGLDDSALILFVGRIAESKQVHQLICAYKDVLREVPEAKLIIVGRSENDDYLDRLKKLATSTNGEVIFTGVVPEDDLPKFYAAADVYASCSIKEGFNLTIAEAEACGTPTVAYDIGAHSEVMENGMLVQPNRKDEFAGAIIETIQTRI